MLTKYLFIIQLKGSQKASFYTWNLLSNLPFQNSIFFTSLSISYTCLFLSLPRMHLHFPSLCRIKPFHLFLTFHLSHFFLKVSSLSISQILPSLSHCPPLYRLKPYHSLSISQTLPSLSHSPPLCHLKP